VKTWAKLTAALFLADLGLGLAVRGLIGMAAAAAAPPPRLLDGRLLAARENYAELTRAAEAHLAACSWARADETATGLPFAVSEARRRLQ
jgi:hypothetical protein